VCPYRGDAVYRTDDGGQTWMARCFGIGPVLGSVPPVSLSDISKLRSVTCTCEWARTV
jgi:hypothetical protein